MDFSQANRGHLTGSSADFHGDRGDLYTGQRGDERKFWTANWGHLPGSGAGFHGDEVNMNAGANMKLWDHRRACRAGLAEEFLGRGDGVDATTAMATGRTSGKATG